MTVIVEGVIGPAAVEAVVVDDAYVVTDETIEEDSNECKSTDKDDSTQVDCEAVEDETKEEDLEEDADDESEIDVVIADNEEEQERKEEIEEQASVVAEFLGTDFLSVLKSRLPSFSGV